MVCQLRDAREETVALQSEVAQAQQERCRIELEAQQKAKRERLGQEKIQTLLARIASTSDDEDVSEEYVVGVLDEIEDWLPTRPDADDETSVSSNLDVDLLFQW